MEAFKQASGVDVPYQFVDRRPGDVAWLWCSPIKAKGNVSSYKFYDPTQLCFVFQFLLAILERPKVELGWEAQYNITDMCTDMWRFQSSNPTGYVSDQPATTPKTSLFAKYVHLVEPVSPTPEL